MSAKFFARSGGGYESAGFLLRVPIDPLVSYQRYKRDIAHRNIKRYFHATNISVDLSFIKLLQSFLEIKFALRPTMSPKIKYEAIRFKIIKTVL